MCEVFGGPHSAEVLTGSPDRLFPGNVRGFGLGTVAMEVRRKCLADPLYLGVNVLSYGRSDRYFFADPTEEHKRCAKAIVEQRNFLLLMPRNHGKTTLADEYGTVWQLLKYPNDRILFGQASIDNAKGLSGQVRGHFVSNRVLRELFPEYAMDSSDEAGNIMSWSVPCRTAITREKSLELGTPETNLAGRHYDVICASDIMNEQTTPPPTGVGTIELMLKQVSWYGNTPFLLDSANPRAHRRIDGTRYHDADLYGEILKNPDFEHIVCGIADDAEGLPIPIWSKVSRKKLLEIRNSPSMTAAKWASQMRNDPLPPQDSTSFRDEWFEEYDLADRPAQMDIAITVDPAFTKQDKNRNADRSALIVSGVAPDGLLYVLAWRAGRWGPRELLETLHSLIDTWSPSWVGIESGTQTESLKEMFFEDMTRTGRFVPYRELKPKGQDKIVRAMPLLAFAEKWHIRIPRGDVEFKSEFLRFPVGKHEDLVDALAYRAQSLYTPTAHQAIRPAKLTSAPSNRDDSADGLLERMDERGRRERMPYHLRRVV